jgi:hypothetical protein
MFSFGVQVRSTGLLYIPPVSYDGTESGFNFLHCVGEHCCIKVNHFQLFIPVHFQYGVL